MTPGEALPDGPLVAWYGDDFTGAAAVMEVLTFAGLPSVLFFSVPTSAQLAKFPGIRGIGVASVARSKSPAWMEQNLPCAFRSLAKLCNGLLHYKVCSTLDSSPQVGSIGKAIEIGAEIMNVECIPILIAAPQMRRYQCFGHLFAGMGGEVFRLDQHPVMRRHPVTPMSEADVAKHLQLQSESVFFNTISLEKLQNCASIPGVFSSPFGGLTGLAIDNVDAQSEAVAGALIWNARDKCRFVVGSQGVEFALIRHWQDAGFLAKAPPPQGIGRAERMVTISGSTSPVNAQQIAWARDNGYICIKFDIVAVYGAQQYLATEIERVVDEATDVIRGGADPLIYTSEGPDDCAVAKSRHALKSSELDFQAANQKVGETLGQILAMLIQNTGIRRAVIAGGDTSGYAVKQLGIFALTALAPTITGASIFRVCAEGQLDGMELALKGGQMGSVDYFGWIKNGGGKK